MGVATAEETATGTAMVATAATTETAVEMVTEAATANNVLLRTRRTALWTRLCSLVVLTSALFGAIALVISSASAQQERASVPGRSLEAALKSYCPGKNLEFLEQSVLDRAIQDFLREQAPSTRSEITDATARGAADCSGAQAGACRSAVTLGVLRQRNLSDALAQRMCELPYRCSDWFTCVAQRSAPPPPPGNDPALGEPDPPTAALPHPAGIPLVARTPREAVLGFYGALARGDGVDAVRFIIPEKRGRGPFSAEKMQRFYGGLLEPLTLQDIVAEDEDTFRVAYRFRRADGSACDGRSIVSVRDSTWGFLVESIRALTGC